MWQRTRGLGGTNAAAGEQVVVCQGVRAAA